MKLRTKIKALVVISVITSVLLIAIQYDLVRHHYEQTLISYKREVKEAAGPIIGERKILPFEIMQNLGAGVRSFSGRRLTDRTLVSQLAEKNDSLTRAVSALFNTGFQNNGLLNKSAYVFKFDEFTVDINGSRYPVAATQNKLYDGYARHHRPAKDLLPLLSFQGSFHVTICGGKTSKNVRVVFSGMQYADISGMDGIVFRRASGLFAGAAALLLSVALLFYFSFSAILRQKKISEIQTDFVNNVTHELKTPLSSAAIIVKSLALPEIREDSTLFDELLGSLARQHDKIRQTADEVLEIETASPHFGPTERLDMTDFLRTYLQDLKVETHQLVIDIAASSVLLRFNRKALEKALDNLIGNAVKYSPENSRITIRAAVRGSHYLVSISDEGAGIAPKHQRLIFDKFYRVPEHNLHTVKGLGLGLYVSRQAIRKTGGELLLEHSGSEGSTFTLKFPVHEN